MADLQLAMTLPILLDYGIVLFVSDLKKFIISF